MYKCLYRILDIKDDFSRAKDLYKWNKFAFNILGVWPLEPSYIRFNVWIVYIVMHITGELADLFYVFGNLELMVLNLSESTLATMVFVKMVVIRYSKTLKKLMIQIIDGIDERLFDDPEEKKIYLRYNRIAKSFFRMWSTMAMSGSAVYFLKPLEFRLKAVLGNESMPFVISYRTRLFFDVNDSLTFWLVWIYQFPMIYVRAFYSITIGYLFSMILHVCGQLSVLAYRIKSIDLALSEKPDNSTIIFRDIVETHCNILGIARDIESVFNLLLLEELFVSTLIVGLASYSVIVSADLEESGECLSFFVYGVTMLFLINGYCIAGEYLIIESKNVYDAYYQCRWYDLSNSSKKQLMICMIGATKPILLTGGGFYVFSLAGFTSVLKTIMGYISMLRTIV